MSRYNVLVYNTLVLFLGTVIDMIKNLPDNPIYPTGIASKIVGILPKTIINYENFGILRVKRSSTDRRLFSKKDILILFVIKFLIKEKGLNFNGAKLFVDLLNKQDRFSEQLLKELVPKQRLKKLEKVINSY